MAKDKEYTADDIVVLTDREHCRLRTNLYLGSMHPATYIIPLLSESNLKLEQVTFIPAVYKAVGEIIDNSLDEFSHLSSRAKLLTIDASPETGFYKIADNGRGIPIDKKIEMVGKIKKEIYTPEIAVSHLRAGRNFTDDKEVGVIGQNGVGSSCVNFCCTDFVVDILREGKRYRQKFTDGALRVSKPQIVDVGGKSTGTELSFQLDPLVFQDISLPSSLIRNRAIEIAMTNPDVAVEYNGEKFRYKKGMQEYISGIAGDKTTYRFDVNEPHIQGEIFLICDGHDGLDEQMFTWVNSSLLFDGGKCNTQFFNLLFDRVGNQLEREAKKLKAEVTKNDIRRGLLVFANLKIKNPEYDSQSKTRLVGPDLRKELIAVVDSNWKSFTKAVSPWLAVVLERANERYHYGENKRAIEDHEKQIKKKIKVPGLLDATSRNRFECQLLITEGLCQEENTKIKTITDLGILAKKLKDVCVGDVVITHRGNFKPITSVTKTTKTGIKLMTTRETLICSREHRYLVYDKKTQVFDWLAVSAIDKNIHQLVRSRLGDFIGCDTFEVTLNRDCDCEQFPYIIQTKRETIKSSATHTFIVLNVDNEHIEEVACGKLNQNTHWLLLFSSTK